MALELKAPVEVQIELTQECNQSCVYCYNYWKSRKVNNLKPKHLSCDQILQIVKELSSNKVFVVYITGGEPFVRKKELFTFLDATKKVGIATSINSNFSLVSSKEIEKLAKEYPDVSILVSVLASESKLHEKLTNTPKGTYVTLMQNISHAIECGISVSINMVVLRQNIGEIRKLAEIAKNMGVQTFCATKILLPATSKKNELLLSREEVLQSLKELIKIEKDLNINVDILHCYPKCLLLETEAYHRFSDRVCVAGISTVTLGADGEVRPCSLIPVSYGNIFHERLSVIWDRMNIWRKGNLLPSNCRSCQDASYCNGGCRANSLTTSFKKMDLYATPAKSVVRNKTIPFEIENSDKSDHFPKKVIVSSSLKLRDESFGATIFSPKGGIIFVNRSTASYLKAIKGNVLTFNEFLDNSGASNDSDCEKVKKLYLKLVRKHIFISI